MYMYIESYGNCNVTRNQIQEQIQIYLNNDYFQIDYLIVMYEVCIYIYFEWSGIKEIQLLVLFIELVHKII